MSFGNIAQVFAKTEEHLGVCAADALWGGKIRILPGVHRTETAGFRMRSLHVGRNVKVVLIRTEKIQDRVHNAIANRATHSQHRSVLLAARGDCVLLVLRFINFHLSAGLDGTAQGSNPG
jgi:hypothetical protein